MLLGEEQQGFHYLKIGDSHQQHREKSSEKWAPCSTSAQTVQSSGPAKTLLLSGVPPCLLGCLGPLLRAPCPVPPCDPPQAMSHTEGLVCAFQFSELPWLASWLCP